MTSAADVQAQRRASGAGEDAFRWFAQWGMSVDAASGLECHGDVLDSPEARLTRVWHTSATVTVPATGRSVVILPSEGTLHLAVEGRGGLGELRRGAFAVVGADLGYTLRTTSPTSRLEVRTSAPIGGDLLGRAEAQLLRDPDQLQAIVVQVVNAALSSELQPDSVAFDHVRRGLEILLAGAIVGARAAHS